MKTKPHNKPTMKLTRSALPYYAAIVFSRLLLASPASVACFALQSISPPRVHLNPADCDVLTCRSLLENRNRGPKRNVISRARQNLSMVASPRGGDQEASGLTLSKFRAFTEKNFFLLGMIIAVSLARIFPMVRCHGRFGTIFKP